MFIELSEYLACPGDHEPTPLVVATGIMDGRDIVHGTVGCPACNREFLIEDSVARFGSPPARPVPDRALPDPADVQAVLGLGSPGGYATLIGSAAGLAARLTGLMPGVHLVVVNAPADLRPEGALSPVEAEASVPLKDRVTRGIVVGAEYADPAWLAEAARVLLRGQRLVLLTEQPAREPAGVELLAVGRGMWVGKKR